MKNLTVLLVEPSPIEAGLLSAALERLDLKVKVSYLAEKALELLSTPQPIHLVLANWAQAGTGGLEIADKVQLLARVPIPVVLYSRTANHEEEVAAREHGVAALMSSPMSQSDLYQYLHPVLRERHPWAFPVKLVVGDLELDKERHTVTRRGKQIDLSPSQFNVLEVLARRRGEVCSREDLYAAFSQNADGNIRGVDVHIQRLKAALTISGSAPPIKAIRGKGYVLV